MGLFRDILNQIVPGRYDYKKYLEKYTDALLKSKLDTEHLYLTLPYLLAKELKLSKASVAVFNPAANNYQIYSAEKGLEPQLLDQNSALIQELMKKKTELVLSEVKNFALQAEMKKLESVLIIPGFGHDQKLIFIINLGLRKSGEEYGREDMDYFKKYADRIAAYFQNVTDLNKTP